MKPICQLLCCILLVGCSSGEKPVVETQIKQTAAENTPDEANAAAPEPSPDIPNPMDVVHKFYDGIFKGDIEQTRSVLIMNDQVENYLQANIEVVEAMDRYAEVDKEYFGGGGMPKGMMKKIMAGRLEKVEATIIDDEHAEVLIAPPTPLKLILAADGWKIDFTQKESVELLDSAPETLGNNRRVLDEVREGILAGTFISRAEASKEMARLKKKYGR